ncbi:MAG: ABC transporter substrate-binding protein [Leptolyngbya sp. SIO4C5]|nr:ABC transporter substrate-binding protein [Leptolyngbya sp. SIO4C5]
MNQWQATLLIGLIAGAIAACAPKTSTEPVPEPELTPEVSQSLETLETAERIVALTSLTADLVQTLNAERLVGVPGSPLIQQDERFAGLEVVSEGQVEPNLEKIVALEPDLVIGAEGFHDQTLQRLEELDVPTLAVDVDSWASLENLTTALAQMLAANPQPLLDRYEACLAQAPAAAPTAVVLVSRQPLLSPNKDSWAGDFLAQFNLQNLTAELQGQSPFDGYITLSEEKVLEANPEVLLVVETGENLLNQLKADAFWGELQAVQQEQVYTFDYFGLVNPGSLAEIERTCKRLGQVLPP